MMAKLAFGCESQRLSSMLPVIYFTDKAGYRSRQRLAVGRHVCTRWLSHGHIYLWRRRLSSGKRPGIFFLPSGSWERVDEWLLWDWVQGRRSLLCSEVENGCLFGMHFTKSCACGEWDFIIQLDPEIKDLKPTDKNEIFNHYFWSVSW